jgi:hypothetical protein
LRGRILRYPGLGRSDAKAPDPEVVAAGLRNPWRFSEDPVTGKLWIGDVGQARWEEIDVLDDPGGDQPVDFGWDLTEGFDRFRGIPPKGMTYPVAVIPHDDQHCAVTLGPIVRDPKLPDLTGTLAIGDYCSSDVRFLRMGKDGRPIEHRRLPLDGGAKTVGFATGLDQEVYVLVSDGRILRLGTGDQALLADEAPIEAHDPPTLDGPRAICGLPSAIAGFPAIQGKDPAQAEALGEDLRAALAAYRSADLPPAAQAPFATLDDGLTTYLDALEAAGWDTTDPDLAALLAASTDNSAAYAALAAVEQEACQPAS